MIVNELIAELLKMPPTAVVVAFDPEREAFLELSKPHIELQGDAVVLFPFE